MNSLDLGGNEFNAGMPCWTSFQSFGCFWNLLPWHLREGSDLNSFLLPRGPSLARMSPHTGSC